MENKMKLRKHQAEAQDLARQIVDGVLDQKIVCAYVTPGGGKTILASIFAHELVRGDDVDQIMIVCPRDSLQDQMRDGFTVPALGLTGGIQKGSVRQRALVRAERMGYVTTYQAVAANPSQALKAMSNRSKERWLLVLDESHHLPADTNGALENSGWTKAVAPLVERAKRVLLMSGTMSRDDKTPLAFVYYGEDRVPKVDIRCTRRQALAEQAVLNVSVKLCDGKAAYWHKFNRHTYILSDAPEQEESRSLRTLLGDENYRNPMLAEAIAEWSAYRTDRNPRARMIVVCENTQAAEQVHRHLNAAHPKWKSVLATSKVKDARKSLADFRARRDGHILVTCQMAYEGLDVPDCTHLVCLTNIRSRPWLEQAFARITRFDREACLSWEEQYAFLYVPNDPRMVAFLSEWLDEQDGRYADAESTGTGTIVRPRGSTFAPEDGELTDVRFAGTDGMYSDVDQRRIKYAREKHAWLQNEPNVHVLAVARDMWPVDSHVPFTLVKNGAPS